MASMTSAKLKTVLKNMADFNHAIVYAQEILDAVDEKEKQLPALDKEIEVKKKQIDDITAHVESLKKMVPEEKQKLNAITASNAAEKERLNDSLKNLRAAVKEAQGVVDGLKEEALVARKKLADETSAARKELEQARNSYESFMASLPKRSA